MNSQAPVMNQQHAPDVGQPYTRNEQACHDLSIRVRDLNLWYASLICSVLLAAGALASILLGELLPPRQIPLAWLVAPLLEGLAGLVCAISIGASRAKNSRFGERLLVGGYAALQTIATIAALMALQPPGKASNAWLATTLWRVGMCCMLTLTSLWPNRLHEEKLHSSEDFLQPPPGSPSLQSPMARALLQQPDNASSGARSQRDVWAEWLTYSSAQIAGDLTGGGNGQSTSASSDWRTCTMRVVLEGLLQIHEKQGTIRKPIK